MTDSDKNTETDAQPSVDITAEERQTGNETDTDAPTFWQVMLSVMAAALGVQNARNRERDFTKGNPLVFIAAGLIFTVLFVLTLVGVVYLVL